MTTLPRRDFLKMAGLGAAGLVLPQTQAWYKDKPSPAVRRPNVVIVLTDDQGYGDLACNGNPILKTPNMDRLANESTRFTNFHVDAYCTPSRSALMTGRYCHRVGGWGTVNGRNMLRDDEMTMADVFRHNGYRTGHFGKWHLGTHYPYRPIDRGFEEWLGHGDGGTGCTTDYWGNDRVNDHYIHNGQWEDKPRKGYECDVFFEAAMQFIRDHKKQPFFTYLAPYNPHGPCSLPDRKLTDPYREKVSSNVADFYATIARVDQNLGKLRQFLTQEGLAENTLLIFISDNGTADGENVFNAGMRGRKGSYYDGGHRVPCFLHWAKGGYDGTKTINRLTAHLDLLPTLTDLCSMQLPRPVKFDGTSLKSLLENPATEWPDRTIVMGTPMNQVGSNQTPPAHGIGTVMTERWRLVHTRELYDMQADPGQKHDVAKAQPETVAQLLAAYEAYWRDVSVNDKDWRGRPIIGSPMASNTVLCAEDWFTSGGNCPWNQANVASGVASFGYWPVRFAETGIYRVELRRWPRELNAPISGIPSYQQVPDAWLGGRPVSGTLYRGKPRALGIAQVKLKINATAQVAAVSEKDTAAVFTVKVDAGPADIEATLLDKTGTPLCGAYYVEIRKL